MTRYVKNGAEVGGAGLPSGGTASDVLLGDETWEPISDAVTTALTSILGGEALGTGIVADGAGDVTTRLLYVSRAPVAPSCVARWKLDDAGTTIADSVGAYDLAYSGSAAYQKRPSPWGKCLFASGSLAAGAGPKGATTLEPAAVTVILSVRPYSYPGTTPYLVIKRQNDATMGAAPNDGAIGLFSNNGLPTAYVNGSGGVTTATPVGAERRLPLDVWSQVAITYDATAGLALYVDGQLAATAANVGAIDYASHGSWSIGTNNDGSGASAQALDGFERDVQICNAALTAAQILAHYQQCVGTYEAP